MPCSAPIIPAHHPKHRPRRPAYPDEAPPRLPLGQSGYSAPPGKWGQRRPARRSERQRAKLRAIRRAAASEDEGFSQAQPDGRREAAEVGGVGLYPPGGRVCIPQGKRLRVPVRRLRLWKITQQHVDWPVDNLAGERIGD